MSRAFVNDDANDSNDDEAPELKIPIPSGSRNYVTPEGAARLSEELSRLETDIRPRLAAEIDKAAKSGSGADELSVLRRGLARADRRIEYLSRMASMAETVERRDGMPERVIFGAAVSVADNLGIEQRYRIVGVDEADPEIGLIAWISPVAKALMGKKVGNEVVVTLPEHIRTLTIISIE